MAKSVFTSAANSVAGTFSTNNGGMSAKDVPLGLVTNVSINYSQTVNRIFDMNMDFRATNNKSPMYYVGGRAQGGVSIGRILGPKNQGSDAYCQFYQDYGNVCGIKESLLFSFKADSAERDTRSGPAGECKKTNMEFTVIDPLLTTIGITQNANDVIINENVNFMFADLQCGGGAVQ